MRILHNIDYKIPTQSEITRWLNSASAPSIAGIECELVPFQDVNLFVITIPPTFDLHETIREFNASGHFSKHTVFMRQDEHTVPASVRDGVTIQQRKHLYRQEIANPSSTWISAIACGIVAFILSNAAIRLSQTVPPVPEKFVPIIFVILGIIFGAEIGWIGRVLKETHYDWRYLTWRQRITFLAIVLFTLAAIYFLNLLLKL